ncbi:diaminobutyrate acetyltransferase [Tsukamurella soli]|uniref:L-2,4-diaminobutyric acid acetyltransferase n=1 Tax=Tsukamurella soli TaxID=644556 RepID=A0ABP8JSS5_9ACTN
MHPIEVSSTPGITEGAADDAVSIRPPAISDGTRLWEIARDTAVLDLNSTYAYTLWCADFTETSCVAERDGEVVGFITGYIPPSRPDTIFIWQVAVDGTHRGLGIAGRMLNGLLDRLSPQGISRLETTITPSNKASDQLFRSVARARYGTLSVADHFDSSDISPRSDPHGHEPERIYTITPV